MLQSNYRPRAFGETNYRITNILKAAPVVLQSNYQITKNLLITQSSPRCFNRITAREISGCRIIRITQITKLPKTSKYPNTPIRQSSPCCFNRITALPELPNYQIKRITKYPTRQYPNTPTSQYPNHLTHHNQLLHRQHLIPLPQLHPINPSS